MNICIIPETFTKPTTAEMQDRLHKIHQYHKQDPRRKPADIRLELGESDRMIHKYFRMLEAGEFDDN